MFSKNYQDPSINYPVQELGEPFADYIERCKKLIAEHRQDLQENSQHIIDVNAPFELIPEQPIFSKNDSKKIKSGALLIHGLLDAPFVMRDVGQELQKKGMLVRAILLPGHGIAPGCLLQVDYLDWLRAVENSIAMLAKEVEQIYLVGFSTGAMLALHHTLQNPSQIAGLILMSPAFKIRSHFDFALPWPIYCSRWLKRAAWFYIGNEFDYAKYRSVAFNGIYQVYRLSQAIKKIDHTKQVPCPILMTLSYEDRIVSGQASVEYFLGTTNPKNKLIIYSCKHLHFKDSRVIYRHSAFPEYNIKHFSHISIPVSPDNFHYGKNGDYPLASHVEKHSNIVYGSLDKMQNYFFDLVYKLKLYRARRQRLTFNPDFKFLADQINQFVSD